VDGSPWEKIFRENADIFIDGDDKMYVAQSNKLYISIDAGETFTERSELPSATCRVRKLSNGKLILFAIGNPSSFLLISEDDGLTWTQQYTFPPFYIIHHQMEVYNDKIFVATSYGDGLLVSEDEGATFVQKNNGVRYTAINSIVRTTTGAMFRQSNAEFYRSDDGGETWSSFPASHMELLLGRLAVNAEDEVLYFNYGQGKTYLLNQPGNEWQLTNSNFPFKGHSLNATVTLGNDLYVLFSMLGVFKSSSDGSEIEAVNDGLRPESPVSVAVARDGGILALTNSGISKYSNGSWTTTRNTISGDRISGWDIFSFDNDRLYMDPSVYSDDHGETWSTTSLPADYTRAFIGPDQRMYAYNPYGPDGPRFFTSTDLGQTWEEKNITGLPALGYRQKPLAADANYVYLTGEGARNYEIWKIDPAALNAKLIYSTANDIDHLLVKDGSLYIAKQGQLHRSDDGGLTWNYLPIPSGTIDLGFEFLGNSLWIGSLNGGIQHSSDKGETWTSMNYPTEDYTMRPTGFAVDNDGYVYAGVMNVGVIKSRVPILEPNHKPTSGNVVKQGFEDELMIFATGDFMEQYADDENEPLRKIQIVTLPGEGTLKLEGEPVVENQIIAVEDIDKLVYINAPNLFGQYEFTFRVSDGRHFSETEASAILHVGSVNDAPAFTVTSPVFLLENFVGPYSITPQPATIPFEENETIIYSLQPASSEIVAFDFNSNTGEINLNSIADKHGVIEFELKATDTDDLSSTYTQSISITIDNVNNPPTISAITDVEIRGGRQTVTFTIDDIDNPLSELELTASSSNQSLVRDVTFNFSGTDAERTLSFTVLPFIGEAIITISVSDGNSVVQQSFKVMSLLPPILEPPVGNAITTYPNPADDILNVSLTDLTPPHQVFLLDVTGTVIGTSTESENSFQFQMNDSRPGIYFLHVIDQQNRSTFKRVMIK
jgi:photosystem II stability/assembly factor-like uncharacterized protein